MSSAACSSHVWSTQMPVILTGEEEEASLFQWREWFSWHTSPCLYLLLTRLPLQPCQVGPERMPAHCSGSRSLHGWAPQHTP